MESYDSDILSIFVFTGCLTGSRDQSENSERFGFKVLLLLDALNDPTRMVDANATSSHRSLIRPDSYDT